MPSQCLGRNRDDTPCSAWVQPGRSYCQWHAPELAEQRREWSRRGGVNRSNKARAKRELVGDSMSLQDVSGTLSRLLRRLEVGDAEPSVCTAAANLARALSELAKTTTVEDRLAELEAVAGINRGTA